MTIQPHLHPVVECARELEAALDGAAGVDPLHMTTPDKRSALEALVQVGSRVEELRLRVMAGSDDIATDAAATDVAAWLAHVARLDGAATRRDLRLARALEGRWHRVAAAFADGGLNRGQVEVIVAALDRLPDDLDPEILHLAEQRLFELAQEFGPRQLQILGRRVLDVIAPDIAERAEERALKREERNAARRTVLTTRRNGDGTTDIRLRVADAVADRLLTHLHAYTSPRRSRGEDRRPHDQKLGHAFGAFLENVDPARMPLHGGAATSIVVTMPLDDLATGVGVGLIGDEPISAGQVRRLACMASIIPMVLGAESEILDLGRHRRLFSPAQRKALAIRDVHCRAEGCDIPAAWCEAHHAGRPWSAHGSTDLAEGVLLCSWHHQRVHDEHYEHRRHPDGSIRFYRRT